MKQKYLLIFALFIAVTLNSCSDSNDDYEPISPVVLDVTQVPYPTLSEYKFFTGDLKSQNPAHKVLPYKPASELFSDYAHKKRFIWMPSGVQATYNGDGDIFNFPVGTVLIKTFYYDNVQPANSTKIIETRLLIKIAEATPTNSGWKHHNYIWNDDQTEAYLDVSGNGKTVPVTFLENNVSKTTNYRVPSSSQCFTCHKLNPELTSNGEVVMPIGVKPQNLNFNYQYGSSSKNQLKKWQEMGYIDGSLPQSIVSTVDWKDSSQPLALRARSYIDINCAHCHRTGAHCDYMPMRFNFSNTNMTDFGVCVVPSESLENNPYIIKSGFANESELIGRISSEQASIMMPLIGRTLVHDEGVALVSAWINSLNPTCD